MSKLSDLPKDLRKQNAEFERFVTQTLPDHIEYHAQKLVTESFQKEQYQGENSSKWAGRKNDKESSKARTSRRALLVGAAELIRSVEVYRVGPVITIGSDKVYAQIHNEGLQGMAFGKYPFQMPKRQFMPIPGEDMPSAFDKEVEEFANKMMDKIFN